MKYFVTIIFLFLTYITTLASFDMNKNMRDSYSYLIDLDFDKSRKLLEKEKEINMNNGIIHLYENYIDFLTLLIGEDKILFEELSKSKSSRIRSIKSNDKSSPFYLYIQAEINLQWAFTRLKFKEYINAIYEIQKAYFLLKKNQELFPEFALNRKGLGVLYCLIGSIPSEYQWTVELVGMKGGVEQGISEINRFLTITEINSEYQKFNIEALFLLSFLHMNITHDRDSYEMLLDKIATRYKKNDLLAFASARLASKLGKNDLVIEILSNRSPTDNRYPMYYLDYLLGMSKLYNLDYISSSVHFKYFLENFSGLNYVKSAYHKLALISFLLNDDKKMQEYLQLVLINGETIIDEDRKADSDIKNDITFYSNLLKAQFLYDGGYYSDALIELGDIQDSLDFEYCTEYWYRKGRIFQALNRDQNKVIDFFYKSYKAGRGTSTYFSPMSALQIGVENEKKGNFLKAIEFYNICLEMSGFDYERGIHQQAKNAVHRLKN